MSYLIELSPGSMPLGWVLQILTFQVFGYSIVVARLPSAVASVISCICLLSIARRMHLRIPWLAAVVFALLPLQFRYALEGRPYALGVMFSLLATWFFLRLAQQSRVSDVLGYSISVAAGLYTQPLSIFVAIGHLIWTASHGVGGRLKLAFTIAGSLALAVLACAPWYLCVRSTWAHTISTTDVSFNPEWKTPLLLLREISGAGYIGSALLILFVFAAVWAGRPTKRASRLLLLLVIVPAGGALCMDVAFGYFVAIRQMIYILPALALLAAEGIATLYDRSRIAGRILASLLIVVFLEYDHRWLTRPREDWAAAAQSLLEQTTVQGACLVFVPSDSAKYYRFFRPSLQGAACSTDDLRSAAVIIRAVSPYPTGFDDGQAQVAIAGRRRVRHLNVGGTVIEQYR
ncbi:MAG TPA: glycosyltransferase family 39 protein [Bryobacteraceae bacterium]|nr:glycosyltransferase family 39 protein [Bryobacteraceae bacterium]